MQVYSNICHNIFLQNKHRNDVFRMTDCSRLNKLVARGSDQLTFFLPGRFLSAASRRVASFLIKTLIVPLAACFSRISEVVRASWPRGIINIHWDEAVSVLLSSPRSFTVIHFYAPLSVFFVGGSSTRLQPYMKFGWFYLPGNPFPSITSTLRGTVSLIAARHRDFIEREDLPLFFLTSSSKIHPDYSNL